MSVCENKDAFQPLVLYTNQNSTVQNTSIEDDVKEAQTLYSNAKFYYTNNEFSGALVSYSCSAVLLNSIVRQLPTNSPEKTLASEILNCCLSAVQILQDKVKSSSGSSGSSKDDEKKDWGKICTNLQPLVFSKGSSDCLFFSSVAGLRKEKELFRTSLIFPLSYPNLYPKASKGILIYGPPGTGKTYIVKAAVNELQKTDPKVGVLFFAPSPGDLKGKYVGETEKKIEEWFTCASRAACESQLGCPNEKKFISLVFMDEFDAIAPDRNTDTTGLAANSVNTLLQMMDGINSKENVAVVAATNYPWNLDSAILRRFDTQILIDLPKKSDIRELLNIEMKKIIKFREVKDPNAFCLAEKKKESSENDSSNNKKASLNCNLECIEEIPIDLTATTPYNQMIFDYYSDASNNGAFITGLVQILEEKHFSNSDVSRLIKAAATYTGQLCIKNNLFYSTKLLSDYKTDEKFISTMTKLKNEDMAILYSIKVLNSYIDPISNPFPELIYQLVKPKFVNIKYNNDDYINVKCMFYKDNNLNIDDPNIKDVYIKFNKTDPTVDRYKKEVVDKRIFDVIITFDFSIKESSSIFQTDLSLPVSSILINSVFKPIYNIFQDVKKTIEEFEFATLNLTKDQIKEKIKTMNENIEKSKKLMESYNTARKSYINGTTAALKKRIDFLEGQLEKVVKDKATAERNAALKAEADRIAAADADAKRIAAKKKAARNPGKTDDVDYFADVGIAANPNPDLRQRRKGGGPQEAQAWASKNYELTEEEVNVIKTNKMFNIVTDKGSNVSFFTSGLKKMLNSVNLPIITGQTSKIIDSFNTNNYNFYSYILLYKIISEFRQPAERLRADGGDPNNPAVQNPFQTVLKRGVSEQKLANIELYLKSISGYENIKLLEKDIKSELARESNILPFPIVNMLNGNESVLLLDVAKNVFLVTIEQYKTFIPNFEDYSGLNLFENGLSDKENFFIEIDTSFFIVLFKNYFNTNEIKSLYKSKTGKELKQKDFDSKLDYVNKATQPLIQLYLNDVFNFYNLSKTLDSPESNLSNPKDPKKPKEPKDILVEYLTGYLELTTDNLTISLLELICMRIHNNFDFVSFNQTFVLDEKINYNDLWNPKVDATPGANANPGGGGRKNVTSKCNNNSTKNKTCKNRSDNKIQYGGDSLEDEYNAFIGFCLGNSETETTKKIIKKTIYVKTQIDLDSFVEQRRKGILIGLLDNSYSFVKGWKDFFMNKTPEEIQLEQDMINTQMLQDLKRKNQYLPLIFKEISAIGFLTDKEGLTTVKDDDDILSTNKPPKIEWIEIANSAALLSVFTGAKMMIEEFLTDAAGFIAKWSIYITGTTMSIAGVTALFDFVFGQQLTSGFLGLAGYATGNVIGGLGQLISSAWGLLPAVAQRLSIAFTIMYSVIDLWDFVNREKVNEGYILNSIFLKTIFSMITDIRYITVTSLENTTASKLFVNSIKLDFFNATDSWKSTFSSIINSDLVQIIWTRMSMLKKFDDPENPKYYDVILYENTNKEPTDIKKRLTNLNIPFSAFSYALTVVQSTYVKETGEQLTQYYNNKDKFMEEYKKKTKKQSS